MTAPAADGQDNLAEAPPPRAKGTGPKARARFLWRQLDPDRPMEIADIGARITKSGPPYATLMGIEGATRLTGFEPDAGAFERLQTEAPANATYHRLAIGKPGPATFYAHQIGPVSSVFRFSAPSAAYLHKMRWIEREVTEVPITLVGLDDVPDLPELDILQSGRKALAHAVCVIPEVRFYRMYEGEPLWADVDAELRAQGLVLHKFLHQAKVGLGGGQKTRFAKGTGTQLLDGDAVYIRSLETPEAVDTVQLKMLALAADSVFRSYDLCAYCLDLLADRGAIGRRVARRYVDRLPADQRVPE